MTGRTGRKSSGGKPPPGGGLRLPGPAGVPLVVRGSFLNLLFLAFLVLLARGDSLPSMAGTGLLAGVALAAVLIHEYAHALAARRAGVHVEDVQIRLFYCAARIEPPPSPRAEVRIAGAGPLASVCAALLALPFAWSDLGPGAAFRPSPQSVFFLANGVMGLVNLLPGLPLDGGRVLRAMLEPRIGRTRATGIALGAGAGIGIAAALAPVFLGGEPLALAAGVLGAIVLALLIQEILREARLDRRGPD